MTDLSNIVEDAFDIPTLAALNNGEKLTHPPRILLLYGSLRERSMSRLVVEESARILQKLGCETRIFNPQDLPVADS